MFYSRYILTAAWAATFLGTAGAADTAEHQFQRLAAEVRANQQPAVGELFEVDIDLATSPGFSVEQIGDVAEIRYRMAFNNIAEGWSWRPLADVAVDDYYRYKFLPLQSVTESRGEYAFEDKIGEPQQMKVEWRYDYFLAFENLYDFYPRAVDDDAGFVARVPASKAHKVTMRATARLIEPVISESTTFWKATYGKPTDFTLKKRYLVGVLETISFIDGESGRVLQRLAALPAKQ
ncbi:MAG: hypothetical protein RLZZ298_3475 [Pseudomonadota bacterium]|jgi:hypothetical protein